MLACVRERVGVHHLESKAEDPSDRKRFVCPGPPKNVPACSFFGVFSSQQKLKVLTCFRVQKRNCFFFRVKLTVCECAFEFVESRDVFSRQCRIGYIRPIAN